MEAVDFLARWWFCLFGITWIGFLYYVNFVSCADVATASGSAQANAITKLERRGMLWLRHGALLTILTGVVLFLLMVRDAGAGGLPIDTIVASAMATLMFLNIWLIIWPNWSRVIKSTESVQDGDKPQSEAEHAAAKAFLALRTNALLSVPFVLLTMTAGSPRFTLGAPHSHGDVVHISIGALAICLALAFLTPPHLYS